MPNGRPRIDRDHPTDPDLLLCTWGDGHFAPKSAFSPDRRARRNGDKYGLQKWCKQHKNEYRAGGTGATVQIKVTLDDGTRTGIYASRVHPDDHNLIRCAHKDHYVHHSQMRKAVLADGRVKFQSYCIGCGRERQNAINRAKGMAPRRPKHKPTKDTSTMETNIMTQEIDVELTADQAQWLLALLGMHHQEFKDARERIKWSRTAIDLEEALLEQREYEAPPPRQELKEAVAQEDPAALLEQLKERRAAVQQEADSELEPEQIARRELFRELAEQRISKKQTYEELGAPRGMTKAQVAALFKSDGAYLADLRAEYDDKLRAVSQELMASKRGNRSRPGPTADKAVFDEAVRMRVEEHLSREEMKARGIGSNMAGAVVGVRLDSPYGEWLKPHAEALRAAAKGAWERGTKKTRQAKLAEFEQKMPAATVMEVYRRHLAGEYQKDIGKAVGLSESQVSSLLRGKTRQDLHPQLKRMKRQLEEAQQKLAAEFDYDSA